ncbi:MAG TPA: type II toxin-antitoxin system RelE/ParE family toxin [Phycisphaerales bacterium]|nr:type II toxin-antitoxin system RelE/ParE family toxin [Phycisphaerales bacterium]
MRIKKSAQKELASLPSTVLGRVGEAIESLSTNPRPTGAVKLTGTDHDFRIRVGVYRVIYSIDDKSRTVEVMRVRHRKDAYRDS